MSKSYKKGLDTEVILWRKYDQLGDKIRFNSDKEVYVSNRIRYTNGLYWRDEINKLFSSINVDNCDDVLPANSRVDKSKTVSVDTFRKSNLCQDVQVQKSLQEYAVSCGHNKLLSVLIDSGMDINMLIDHDHMRNMLHLAVLNTDISKVRYLVSHGVDVNCRDYKVR